MNPVGGAPGLQGVLALRQQILDRNEGLRALQQATDTPVAPAADKPVFGETLKGALEQVNASQNRASELAAAYERGEVTDIAQVMVARQESGVAFEATLQVRNKLLSAYQDIMRMGA
ncbi:flagellar hook-basal body complex protein FliE [Altererythrobacter sp. H2]|uniref:flagellar hook-basal body complex protein FliE n=1 Tax=Altererythrobacter sp. H2 TaxID=3108391 RepID=UPI000BC7A09F|nr:flagellar hook-basal body complex protein FliE [Altererythrobacter sp. H2]OZA93588.1 MAG: flagellar hook-basal body complex protein FliE [Erythrobacter sp. 34-65-8]WRK96951.1 flagellar hook-basal body complex protein FliE [Altererythrobacter sp. H2]